MRYRFRGLVRATSKPVEGHVEADTEEAALYALSDNGIVTEAIRPDPKPVSQDTAPVGRSDVASSIDSALDVSSSQIPFDLVAQRYKGKSVWVIDREKIRRRVAQVVDEALSQGLQSNDADAETRKRVAEAIEGLFKDNKNITSPAGGGGGTNPNLALERQIERLAGFVGKAEQFITKAEGVLASISIAASRGGGGGWGDGPRRYRVGAAKGGEQNEVLAEIFKQNLALRGIVVDQPAAPEAGDAPLPN